MYKKTVLGLSLFFTFASGFIAAEVVCYHRPPVRIELALFIFAAVGCLAIGILLLSLGQRIR